MIPRSEIVAYRSNVEVVFRVTLFTLTFSTDSTTKLTRRGPRSGTRSGAAAGPAGSRTSDSTLLEEVFKGLVRRRQTQRRPGVGYVPYILRVLGKFRRLGVCRIRAPLADGTDSPPLEVVDYSIDEPPKVLAIPTVDDLANHIGHGMARPQIDGAPAVICDVRHGMSAPIEERCLHTHRLSAEHRIERRGARNQHEGRGRFTASASNTKLGGIPRLFICMERF